MPRGTSDSESAGSVFPPQPPRTANFIPEVGTSVDGVLSPSQKCVIKATRGPECKLGTGALQEVRDFLTMSWTSNPKVAKQLNWFLKGTYGGDWPRGKEERIQCFWGVLQQLD